MRISENKKELFRGTNSMTPIYSQSRSGGGLPKDLKNTFYVGSGCKMDLYSFFIYSHTFSDVELEEMFSYFKKEYELTDLNMHNKKITNVANPVNNNDAVNKTTVDNLLKDCWVLSSITDSIIEHDVRDFYEAGSFHNIEFLSKDVEVKNGMLVEVHSHLGINHTAFDDIGDIFKNAFILDGEVLSSFDVIGQAAGGNNKAESSYGTCITPVLITKTGTLTIKIQIKTTNREARLFLGKQCGMYIKIFKKILIL